MKTQRDQLDLFEPNPVSRYYAVSGYQPHPVRRVHRLIDLRGTIVNAVSPGEARRMALRRLGPLRDVTVNPWNPFHFGENP